MNVRDRWMENCKESIYNDAMPRNGICFVCGTPFQAGMKFCATCGKRLTFDECSHPEYSNDNLVEKRMRFCSNCGNRVDEKAVICVKCGCALNEQYPMKYVDVRKTDLIETLTQRLEINGIIWLVIAIVQIFIGLFVNWVFLPVGILNLISSIQDLQNSKLFKTNPVGIVSKTKPLVGSIVVLVYNLLVGGVIGVAGSIYYLTAVRGFVMEHESSFLQIEEMHKQ